MKPLRPWKKVTTFGLLGAVGCLLGWAFGEGLLAVGLPASSAQEGPSLAARPEAPPAPPPPEVKRGVAPPSPAAPIVAKREPPPPLPPEVQKLLEAAGGKSGQLHFVLTWQQETDLDLHCIDPNGEEIYYGHKKAIKGSGGELDVDRRNALLTALPADSQKIITTTHLDWMPDAGTAQVLRL